MSYLCDNKQCEYHIKIGVPDAPSVWLQTSTGDTRYVGRKLWRFSSGTRYLCDACHALASASLDSLDLSPDESPAAAPAAGTVLPDGSGFFTASMPLPADHWLTAAPSGDYEPPPMKLRMAAGPARDAMAELLREAARQAIRASTLNGAEPDFDPDALVQNLVVSLLGYWSEDGTAGSDVWANPDPIPPLFEGIGAVEVERDRADTAWKNTQVLEKARQEEMAKRDAAEAHSARLTRLLSFAMALAETGNGGPYTGNALADEAGAVLRAAAADGLLPPAVIGQGEAAGPAPIWPRALVSLEHGTAARLIGIAGGVVTPELRRTMRELHGVLDRFAVTLTPPPSPDR